MSAVTERIDIEDGWPGAAGGTGTGSGGRAGSGSRQRTRPATASAAAADYSRMRGPVSLYLADSEAADHAAASAPEKDPSASKDATPQPPPAGPNVDWWQTLAIYASLSSNVVLLVIKIIALQESNSIAMLAAVLDSAMDILAGGILFMAARVRKASASDIYPIGKRRVSPIATLVFACLMAMSAIQVIIEAVTILAVGFGGGSKRLVSVTPMVIGIVSATISLKLTLAVLCTTIGRWQKSSIVSAYAQDHVNDTITNSVSICGLLLAGKFHSLWYLDSVAAIVICSYITVNWANTGYTLSSALMGRAAESEVVEHIKNIAMSHDPSVKGIDTVCAYYMGEKLFVELHILLPEDTCLRNSHDIGESLENTIEQMDLVERCFVHLDYNLDHCNEHKIDDGI
jgi:cation diffusion facilitator family transporter